MRETSRYTDVYFKKTEVYKPCPYPKHYGRDRRILLSANYENGEVSYIVAVVHSCLDWRSVRVFTISHQEYVNIQAKYYECKAGGFSDIGELFDPAIHWRNTGYPGVFQLDYMPK